MYRLHSSPMLAKKSWDVERKSSPKPVPQQESIPVRKERATRPAKPARVKKTKRIPKPVLSKESLKVRRARARRMFFIFVSVLVLLCIAGLFYVSWSPALRVQEVRAEGPHAHEIISETKEQLKGTHAFILPRNSLFFLPVSNIRESVLKMHPDIVAVAVHSSGLQGITVVASPRSTAYLWCGVLRSVPGECYNVDTSGLIFGKSETNTASSTQSQYLKVYNSVEGSVEDPVRAYVSYASAFPNALRLAKVLKTLQANITELTIENDEASFYTAQGTRITYVIGNEDATATLAASVFPTLNLQQGSVEYIDLRFEGKVYLRRQQTTVVEEQ